MTKLVRRQRGLMLLYAHLTTELRRVELKLQRLMVQDVKVEYSRSLGSRSRVSYTDANRDTIHCGDWYAYLHINSRCYEDQII